MNNLIVLIPVMIALICIIILALTWIEIHRITVKLKEISRKKTNQKVMLSFSSSFLENLVEQINHILVQKQLSDIDYKNKDLQQRQMIANISHDLRTPLTSVIGYIQLLQDENLPEEERKQYMEIVLGRAKALQSLVSDFFDLSRCEAGEFSLDLKTIRLQDILCELMASNYKDFAGKGIQPDIDISETVPCIIADEHAVRRIYQNLIQNALKHGGNSLKISLTYENNTVVSRITNDAPNLTQDDLAHIFDRSFTADRVRDGRNTGLGLSIAKAMTEHMNGVIKASLESGELSIVISWTIV